MNVFDWDALVASVQNEHQFWVVQIGNLVLAHRKALRDLPVSTPRQGYNVSTWTGDFFVEISEKLYVPQSPPQRLNNGLPNAKEPHNVLYFPYPYDGQEGLVLRVKHSLSGVKDYLNIDTERNDDYCNQLPLVGFPDVYRLDLGFQLDRAYSLLKGGWLTPPLLSDNRRCPLFVPKSQQVFGFSALSTVVASTIYDKAVQWADSNQSKVGL